MVDSPLALAGRNYTPQHASLSPHGMAGAGRRTPSKGRARGCAPRPEVCRDPAEVFARQLARHRGGPANRAEVAAPTDGEEKTYGGCEGPDAMYVKLISSDGHEFIVKREHALTSGTIKAMLSGPEKRKCSPSSGSSSFTFTFGHLSSRQ
uniref:SKP1 component POZ domain-containing protein n=1 Tax=Apteryx owenii TaxID=8824 RepID=A0A8B9QBW3_APTOW